MSQQITVTQGRHGDLVVHKAGCAHLHRLPRADYTETFTAASMVAVAERVYADQISESEDWGPEEYARSFEVAPCVTLPFKTEQPA